MDFNKLVHTLNGITEDHNYDSYVNAKSSDTKKPGAGDESDKSGMHSGWGLNNRPSGHDKDGNVKPIGAHDAEKAVDKEDFMGESEDDSDSEDRYDKDGNVKANGAYDAAGHYDAERDADKEDFMSESINKLDDILKLSGLVKESTETTAEENRPWANSPTEKYLDADTMNITLSGGPNAPHAQINPNNMGDNPLAMGSLKMNLEKASLNLKEDAARIEKQLHEQFAAESKDSLAALKTKKAKIDADIEKIVSDGGKVSLTDPLTVKLNKVRADIKKAKKAK